MSVDTSAACVGEQATTAEIVRCLRAMASGNYSELPTGTDEVCVAVRELAKSCQGRVETDLERSVSLSLGVSEAMAAVSFVTGDLREARHSVGSIAEAITELNTAIIRMADFAGHIAEETRDVEASTAPPEPVVASVSTNVR